MKFRIYLGKISVTFLLNCVKDYFLIVLTLKFMWNIRVLKKVLKEYKRILSMKRY